MLGDVMHDNFAELRHLERFHDVRVRSRVDALLDLFLLAGGRYEDHRYIPVGILTTDALDNVKSGQTRHHDIQENGFRQAVGCVQLLNETQGTFSVGCGNDLKPFVFQHGLHNHLVDRIIVHRKDAMRLQVVFDVPQNAVRGLELGGGLQRRGGALGAITNWIHGFFAVFNRELCDFRTGGTRAGGLLTGRLEGSHRPVRASWQIGLASRKHGQSLRRIHLLTSFL
mmetsp:Transcript_12975/g.37279  ORF Transcript_12975/g.37279 Transcript_12975/m.37279 type:complete len:226 (-) Transcript_12975:1843-2520(-)